jgi:hypothetical protein
LEKPGVDDLVTCVTKDAGDDFHATIVAIEPDFGDKNSLS